MVRYSRCTYHLIQYILLIQIDTLFWKSDDVVVYQRNFRMLEAVCIIFQYDVTIIIFYYFIIIIFKKCILRYNMQYTIWKIKCSIHYTICNLTTMNINSLVLVGYIGCGITLLRKIKLIATFDMHIWVLDTKR